MQRTTQLPQNAASESTLLGGIHRRRLHHAFSGSCRRVPAAISSAWASTMTATTQQQQPRLAQLNPQSLVAPYRQRRVTVNPHIPASLSPSASQETEEGEEEDEEQQQLWTPSDDPEAAAAGAARLLALMSALPELAGAAGGAA
ncbi:hypothetical protein Agub_g2910, partial [Astrephomene gubernaculifera]